MTNLESTARKIFQAAVASVDPYEAVQKQLVLEDHILSVGEISQEGRRYDLNRFKRIIVAGAGKAAAAMAEACEKMLGEKISEGLIVTKYGHSRPLERISALEAGHPVPDQAGLSAAQAMLALLAKCEAEDLLIFLTSGGCSAILPLPVSPVSLADKQKLTDLLLRCGAGIKEINTVRKHISMTKGGNMARQAYPSTVINLILSDVVGDDLDVIGSGPFVPDPSTYQDAWNTLEKYGLVRKTPHSVTRHLQSGLQGEIPETPKSGEAFFDKVSNTVIGNNLAALEAAEEHARSMGFKTLILSSQAQGEAKELARFYAAIAKEIVASGHPLSPPACILAGGEPTVTVSGSGLGGRNTELALAMAIEIRGLEGTVFLSGGTDGTDGPTDAAGAVVTGLTCQAALDKELRAEEFLKRNDSYTFFKQTGGLLSTGPTGTNVMDVHILLIAQE